MPQISKMTGFMILGSELLRPVKKVAVSGLYGAQNWAGTLTCKQYHLQAEEGVE
jgi:hypothetical protein